MKTLLSALILFIFSTTPLIAQNSDLTELNDYKWQDRVLLIFSPNTYNSDYRAQVDALQDISEGAKERDLKIFYALEQSSASVKGALVSEDAIDELRSDFDISSSDFVILLIGKDGDEKFRSDEFISSKKLFNEIDSMPMRKIEMGNDGK